MTKFRQRPEEGEGGSEWGFTFALFLGVLTTGLLFLFATKGQATFCVEKEPTAACVREWLAVIAPWAAILGVIWATQRTVRPMIKQLFEARRQSAVAHRTSLSQLAIEYANLRYQTITVSSKVKYARKSILESVRKKSQRNSDGESSLFAQVESNLINMNEQLL